jgi:hypothetical protein
MELTNVFEMFRYYADKSRGETTKEDDKKFNEKYKKYEKPISNKVPDWIRSPEIQKMLKEKTAAMIGS